MTIAEILERVRELGCPVVEITGGEPLAQPNCSRLMEELIAAGFTVLLETSGAFPISPVPRAVHKIMDLKCPGSGEMHRNLYENLAVLAAHDEVKFVLADRTDYEWARDMTRRHVLGQRVRAVLFSCVFGQIEPALLVEWVTQDRLFEARVQLQAHKYIWSPETRSV